MVCHVYASNIVWWKSRQSTIWNFYGTLGLRICTAAYVFGSIFFFFRFDFSTRWLRALAHIFFFSCERSRTHKQLNRNKFMRLSYSRLNLLKWNFTVAANIEPEILSSTSQPHRTKIYSLSNARRSTSSTLGEARNIFILYGLIKKMIDKISKRKWSEKLLQVLWSSCSLVFFFSSVGSFFCAALPGDYYYYYYLHVVMSWWDLEWGWFEFLGLWLRWNYSV